MRGKKGICAPLYGEKNPEFFYYKDHEVNDVISALSYQSSVPLELKKSYRGNMEVAASNELLTAQQALLRKGQGARNQA